MPFRFAGMRDESKNGGGLRDDRNFNSGMRDENRTAGPRYAPFHRRIEDRTSIGGIIS